MERRLAWLALCALTLAAPPARAHEYWLAPSRFSGSPGPAIGIGALAGTGFRGERVPWSPPRVVRFVARTAKLLDLAPAPRPGDLQWLSFAPADGGGALVAFESNFTPIELPATTFDAYLEDQGLAGPLAVRRALHAPPPGRERYRRCAKLWLAGADAARATAPLGLPLELVPLAAPGAAPALRLRVLWQGRPLAGALVRAWREPFAPGGTPSDPEARDSVGVAGRAVSDARGEVALRVEDAGEWLVSVVHMEPCPERAVADWESTWASLLFARSGGGGHP